MLRLFVAGICLILGASVVLALDTEEIMKKLNKKKTGIHYAIETSIKDGKWDAAAKQSKDYTELASALEKNEPEKGDKTSWAKLCKEYAGLVKDLDSAVQKKDMAKALEIHKKISNTCETCHEAHR